MEVQQELIYLIADEGTKKILEVIIDKIDEVGDSSERIKQWRNEVRIYIPKYSKYEEKYWIAAYALYTKPEFKKLFERFANINSWIYLLDYELYELEDKQKLIENRIQNIRDKIEVLSKYSKDEEIENLLYRVKNYENRLQEVKESYNEISDRLNEVEEGKKEILCKMQEFAEQLVIS